MKRIAFFDLKEQSSVYIFEKNGRNFSLKEKIAAFAGDGYVYRTAKPLDNIDESYLSLPMSILNFRIIELPFSDMERIRKVLPFELDNLVLGGSEKIVFDAAVLKEENGKHKILVVYILKDILKRMLDGLKQTGIDARIVTSIETSMRLDSFSSESEITDIILKRRGKEERVEDRFEAALKEINGQTINLRRGEFAYTGHSDRLKKSFKFTAVLAVLLLSVFFSDMLIRIVSAKSEGSEIRNEIRKVYTGIFPAEKKITDELYQLKAHIKELKDRENILAGSDPLQLLLDLSSLSVKGASFTEITLDREKVVLKGECASLSDVQKLKAAVESFLPGAAITDTKVTAQNRASFTITSKREKA